MAVLEVPNDPDLLHTTGRPITDVRQGYRRYEALVAAQHMCNIKKSQDKYRTFCSSVKQTDIDRIFFGKSNVYNYKDPFSRFMTGITTNKHADYGRMQKWLRQEADAPSGADIWRSFYKNGKVQGISDFDNWLKDLEGKVVKEEFKRSHKKKEKQKE